MRAFRVLTAVAFPLTAAAVLAVSAGAAGRGGITASSIAGLRLGLPASTYTQLLHEKPLVTRYGDRTSRLIFAKAQITVIISRSGVGSRITTSAAKYAFKNGVGPCATIASLARTRRLTPVAVPTTYGNPAVVYRDGSLWFTVANATQVGSVSLTSGRPPLQDLLATSQCDVLTDKGE